MHVLVLMITFLVEILIETIELNHKTKMMIKSFVNTFSSFKDKTNLKDSSLVSIILPKTSLLDLLNLSPKFYVIVYLSKYLKFF